MTNIDDFLYATADVAIWSTVETGLGITAAGFATLRPLLRTFFGGGSSAHDTPGMPSGGQWQRTGSENRKDAYGQGASRTFNEAYELKDGSGKPLGVTTVIDVESPPHKTDSRSLDDDSITGPDGWSGSDQDLTDKRKARRDDSAWNIKVAKSIVQTRT
jgi:hypothetical protein